MKRMRPSRRALVFLVLYLALVLWATLGPVPWSGHGYQSPNGVLDWQNWLEPETWTIGLESEMFLNVVMFVPIGALLAFALRGMPAWVPVAAAFGTSLAIELAQIPMADRISDPRDLAANAGGALIGIVIARIADGLRMAFARPAAPQERAATERRLTTTAR
ncbi:VanZ family protein [Agromyces aurantiacus]|uniref:VanZ family protein n=1 Tax=Agromyces aurantiacus TaxID=165814 RepID=A0ABV9R234_9MICO|nr:VanZ family protein [Agromyces aurantiacus]MBM7505966.1 glycopeptide antibiotics resistance protein [Agromyces aurantiacus]